MTSRKKLIAVFIFMFIGFSAVYGKSLKNSRVGVISAAEGNISEIDALLLNGTVKDKLESNLKKYTDLVIVSTNIPELKSIQKATQETGIDKNTAVRMGKLMAADNLLNATVRKSNSTYSISVRVIDLTTGEVLASVQETTDSSDSLWAGNGCAVDLLTIELCDAMGIDLTASQKYVLRYGEKDLSTDEQLKMFKQDCERYQKLIEELNKELSLLDYSTDLDAKEKQIAIQAQREIAEQKLASSLAAQQRMEELRKIQLEEERKEAERSEAQKKKRQEIEAIAQKKINDIRNEKRNKTTAIEEIAYIENEKRTYIEIRDSVNERIEEIEEEKRLELEAMKDEINNRPYRKAHLDADGNPIPEAKELRRQEISERSAEIRAAKSAEIDKVKESVSSNMAELLTIIDNDTKRLAKTKRTASSITDELSVVMGLYDGSKRVWPAHLYFTVDGRDLYSQEIDLSYETVTGKKVTNIMDPDYLDTVDLYDSLFSRGTPVIIYDLEYTVEAMPKDRPSMYKFNFDTLTLKDTKQNLKVIKKQSLDRYKVLHVSPAYDIRSEKELASVAKTEEKKQEKKTSKTTTTSTTTETEKKKVDKITPIKRDAFGITIDILSESETSYNEYGVGFTYDNPVFFPLFVGVDAGIYAPSEEYEKKLNKGTDENTSGFILKVSAGVNLPIANGICDIYAKGSFGGVLDIYNSIDFVYAASVGFEVSYVRIEYAYNWFMHKERGFNQISIGVTTRFLN